MPRDEFRPSATDKLAILCRTQRRSNRRPAGERSMPQSGACPGDPVVDVTIVGFAPNDHAVRYATLDQLPRRLSG